MAVYLQIFGARLCGASMGFMHHPHFLLMHPTYQPRAHQSCVKIKARLLIQSKSCFGVFCGNNGPTRPSYLLFKIIYAAVSRSRINASILPLFLSNIAPIALRSVRSRLSPSTNTLKNRGLPERSDTRKITSKSP